MRKLTRPWTDEETERLKQLHASGATAQRAALAVKRNKTNVMSRARKLGISLS
jgi:GcrA cell cycle regulator